MSTIGMPMSRTKRHRVVAQDPQLVAHDGAQRAHGAATGSGSTVLRPVSAR